MLNVHLGTSAKQPIGPGRIGGREQIFTSLLSDSSPAGGNRIESSGTSFPAPLNYRKILILKIICFLNLENNSQLN